MRTFQEQMEELKKSLNDLITKDTPTEQVTQIGNIKTQLDGLGESHQQTLKDYADLKDRYIDSVKNYGTAKAPANENDGEKKETTFEEIGADLISKRGK